MIQMKLRYFFIFIVILFVSLSAKVMEISLSEIEEAEVANNKTEKYVSLLASKYSVAEIVLKIKEMDSDNNSLLSSLYEHLMHDFSIGIYDKVILTLEYAQTVLTRNKELLPYEKYDELSEKLEDVINAVLVGLLTIDDTTIIKRRKCSHLPMLEINERISVAGKSVFNCDVSIKDDFKVKGKAKFKNNVKFKENVRIKGTLSISDFVVNDCIKNLCVENLSVADGVVTDSLTLNFIPVNPTDAVNKEYVDTISSVGTPANVPNTLILRDNTGSSSAQTIVVDGNLAFTTGVSIPSSGTVFKDNASFIHNTGINNTFFGLNAGNFSLSGANNTGIGHFALLASDVGSDNTALGFQALESDNFGSSNTAVGAFSLALDTSGSCNTVIGRGAGFNILTGSNNTIIGCNVGLGTVTGSNNIYIDGNSLSPADESDTIRIGNTQTACFIKGIFGNVVAVPSPVFINAMGFLGTVPSSEKFKDNISNLGDISEKMYHLNPVSFVFKSDTTNTLQIGLIAEEVEKVFPLLVIKDENNEPYSVRYDVLPVLIINEMQKLHNKVNQLERKIAEIERIIN